MSDIAIRVENLGKQYRLAHKRPHDSLKEAMVDGFRALTRRGPSSKAESEETFWALKDVSFEVKKGEVLGIIGRNGAGKSTLLKILSRITEMTEGAVDIHGRIGSLLEVGTGFHHELTGRENIFLNGAIMGMTQAEVRRKFDEIVAFSEVERFVDTPVKHYSSGMYTRLAFAVAAHLEPEILLIDEVLAVGDLQFQKKCLGKMNEISDSGRTILFVSHNLGSIEALCDRCIYVDHGAVRAIGLTKAVLQEYHSSRSSPSAVSISKRLDRIGSGGVRCTNVIILDGRTQPAVSVAAGCQFYIDLQFDSIATQSDLTAAIGIDTVDGVRLLTLYSDFTGQAFQISAGSGTLRCTVPALNLRPDLYVITTFLGNPYGVVDLVHSAATLEIHDSSFYGTGRGPERAQGPLLCTHTWSMIK